MYDRRYAMDVTAPDASSAEFRMYAKVRKATYTTAYGTLNDSDNDAAPSSGSEEDDDGPRKRAEDEGDKRERAGGTT